jgi:ADP-ribose pyrophosphatase YjhB (NUDIX family)
VELIDILSYLENLVIDPSEGLPDDLFLFVSKIIPLINVDLLIKNEQHQTLLTWRDDKYYGAGWHIPGGIIRYKETLFKRIHAVAKNELGASITFKNEALAVNETIHPSRKARGHFISLLYDCVLTSPPDEKIRHTQGTPLPGQWAWHNKCPENIIAIHQMYKKFI